jgi:hypothetical protein
MPTPTDPIPEFRQITVSPGKEIRRMKQSRSFPGGIVLEPSPDFQKPGPRDVQTADLIFPPIQPLPINVSNGRGAIDLWVMREVIN